MSDANVNRTNKNERLGSCQLLTDHRLPLHFLSQSTVIPVSLNSNMSIEAEKNAAKTTRNMETPPSLTIVDRIDEVPSMPTL